MTQAAATIPRTAPAGAGVPAHTAPPARRGQPAQPTRDPDPALSIPDGSPALSIPDGSPVPAAPEGSDFAVLSARIRAAGLLRRRPGWYAVRITATVAALLGCWASLPALHARWQFPMAVMIAVLTAQIAFLGHDIGHRQVFRTRRPTDLAGLLHGNLLAGLSYGWWMDKHSRHHANPNHSERDPDVGAGALVWTVEQAAARRGSGRFLARYQAWLFFPMLTLEGVNLTVAGIRALATGTPVRYRRTEALLLLAHLLGTLALPLLVMSPGRAVAFTLLRQAVFGLYLGCAFAPNHKGMPMLDAASRLDFLRKQVLTSRNVRGGLATDLLLGGLNYQIEHHLFPSMPRPHLRRAAPLVRAFCAERGIGYRETGAVESYRQGLRHLHEVGRPLRTAPPADPPAPFSEAAG